MEGWILTLGWLGIYAPVALGAIGSAVGCSTAGQAAAGAILETESGHGKFIGLSAMPSSQTIYGIVVMMILNQQPTLQNSPGIFGVGVLSGLALMITCIAQGKAVASAINVSKGKPEIFGLSVAPAAIVEGFSVFAFVFALVLAGSIGRGS